MLCGQHWVILLSCSVCEPNFYTDSTFIVVACVQNDSNLFACLIGWLVGCLFMLLFVWVVCLFVGCLLVDPACDFLKPDKA